MELGICAAWTNTPDNTNRRLDVCAHVNGPDDELTLPATNPIYGLEEISEPSMHDRR